MLSGQRREVVTPGNNQKRYVAGALHSRTTRLTWVQGQRRTSALFIDLVRAAAGAYPDAKRLHFILDNAATHSSKKMKKAPEQMGGRVVPHFLSLLNGTCYSLWNSWRSGRLDTSTQGYWSPTTPPPALQTGQSSTPGRPQLCPAFRLPV